MAVSREAVMQALLNVLAPPGQTAFVTVGRRLDNPENIAQAQKPALFLVEHEDEFIKELPEHPLVQVMTVLVFLYTDVGNEIAGQNAIPQAPLNGLIDALVASLSRTTRSRESRRSAASSRPYGCTAPRRA
jgi:hypothetical protein